MTNFTRKKTAVIIAVLLISTNTFSQLAKTMMVGGSLMYPSKNIVENAAKSKDHSTLIAAVKAAGLVEILKGAGPFTVFAPTNKAFKKLPPGTVEVLLKPENRDKLATILTYHILAGNIGGAALIGLINNSGGSYKAKTVQGRELTFSLQGQTVVIKDEKGSIGKVTIKDVNQSNGVIHVIDTVLLP